MANSNSPFGLRAVKSLGRSNIQQNMYVHDSGDSVAIFINDPVVTTGTSSSSVTNAPDGTPIVVASGSVTTGAIRGSCASVAPTLTNLSLQYGAGSTTYVLYVNDDPFQLFEVQSSGTGAITDVSGNIGILTGSGSTMTGISAYAANESSLGSTNVLRIINISPVVNNVVGAYNLFTVKINQHELTSTSGT